MVLTRFIILVFVISVAFAASPEEYAGEFEGDIKLTREQKNAIQNGLDLEPANTFGASKSKRWKDGVFPYVLASSLSGSSSARRVIDSAMKEWSEKTCIRFVRRTNQAGYVEFFRGGGCWSYVGMTGRKQQISLAGGCWRHGIVVHEIGHALGFWHEQSRPDRDEYVTIMWDNIPSGNRHNFKKYTKTQIDSLNIPYDYASIMHYGRRAFSNNGRDTIVPKKSGVTIGQRGGLSPSDVQQMNLMYNCKQGTPPPPRPTTPRPTPPRPTPPRPTPPRPTQPSNGIKVELRSEGCDDPKLVQVHCGRAYIKVNGRDYARKRRGHNLVILDLQTGRIEHQDKRNVDKLCSERSFALDLAHPRPPVGSCGVSGVTGRLIGGTNAAPGAWPWQIALLKSGRFGCGGSLVYPDWVVTAGHCISRSTSTSSYTILLGAHNRNSPQSHEQRIRAKKVIVHPQYGRPTLNNDIALIQLERPATLTSRISTVCLPSHNFDVPLNSECYITGWGKIRHPGSSHHTLQQARLPPVSQEQCKKKLAQSPDGHRLSITEQMLCAGVDDSILSGCHGDSGGPYVCRDSNNRFVLQGAVSWGSPRCASSERYTVFARVAKFRNWIDSEIRRAG
ncbi:chymotrypsinogen B-like [Paramuricea clavata]|uniref:Chymotrypsinogen B-like n=1 Tax=Paramuricea clavata TaxID=317549 RepID=A0A6S7FX06_PARCT|nr:chymotrypsinogen B-like [Paramuricea clavata]